MSADSSSSSNNEVAAPDPCPLCGGRAASFLRDERDYLRCADCALTFVPPRQHVGEARERARYAEHRNGPQEAGYREFLERLLVPLSAALAPGAQGLDFGCGPGPAASMLMSKRGFPTSDYDPYFRPDESVLRGAYDFIVCTEVLEHLRRPSAILDTLDALLKPGGILGVMTGVLEDDAAFRGWWYRRDFTHIAFYRPQTLDFIARSRGWTLRRPSRDVALFQKTLREHV
jgi:SAM-dependent methyltransferase